MVKLMSANTLSGLEYLIDNFIRFYRPSSLEISITATATSQYNNKEYIACIVYKN